MKKAGREPEETFTFTIGNGLYRVRKVGKEGDWRLERLIHYYDAEVLPDWQTVAKFKNEPMGWTFRDDLLAQEKELRELQDLSGLGDFTKMFEDIHRNAEIIKTKANNAEAAIKMYREKGRIKTDGNSQKRTR